MKIVIKVLRNYQHKIKKEFMNCFTNKVRYREKNYFKSKLKEKK